MGESTPKPVNGQVLRDQRRVTDRRRREDRAPKRGVNYRYTDGDQPDGTRFNRRSSTR